VFCGKRPVLAQESSDLALAEGKDFRRQPRGLFADQRIERAGPAAAVPVAGDAQILVRL
jgi:hypothetical protein